MPAKCTTNGIKSNTKTHKTLLFTTYVVVSTQNTGQSSEFDPQSELCENFSAHLLNISDLPKIKFMNVKNGFPQ
jgi:hypothetical protein